MYFFRFKEENIRYLLARHINSSPSLLISSTSTRDPLTPAPHLRLTIPTNMTLFFLPITSSRGERGTWSPPWWTPRRHLSWPGNYKCHIDKDIPFASNFEDLGQKADKNRIDKELFLLNTVRWLSWLSPILYWADLPTGNWSMGAEAEPPSYLKILAEARAWLRNKGPERESK